MCARVDGVLFVRACMRACARGRVCAFVCVRARERMRVHACECACACKCERECTRRTHALRIPYALRGTSRESRGGSPRPRRRRPPGTLQPHLFFAQARARHATRDVPRTTTRAAPTARATEPSRATISAGAPTDRAPTNNAEGVGRPSARPRHWAATVRVRGGPSGCYARRAEIVTPAAL